MIPIFDAHLDLAWNAVSFNRDICLDLEQLNKNEAALDDHPSRGNCTVSLPEMRKAGVQHCVATLLARSGPSQGPHNQIYRHDLDFAAPGIANAMAQAQLAYYKTLEEAGELHIIKTKADLEASLKRPQDDPSIGIILSMEGTDPILSAEQVAWWHEQGLRAAGLTHYGQGRHAYGTDVEGPISDEGKKILEAFTQHGMALDVTHLSDQSMDEAFDLYEGPLLASHHNVRSLVAAQRQLSDEQIKTILERKGMIGVALDAWMLYPNYIRGETSNLSITLDTLADHIDYYCQMAGNAEQVGLGSDLDGGFGTEQTPSDLKTIADLQKLSDVLSSRDYSDADILNIFSGNWSRFYLNTLP